MADHRRHEVDVGLGVWQPDAVFARARDGGRPVLLSIVAPWSIGCAEMERVTFADAAVVRAIDDGFVAIRVDADQRPDIADRYGLGGLPTTAFLTPGGAVMGGGTYVPPDRLRDALATIASRPLPPDADGAGFGGPLTVPLPGGASNRYGYDLDYEQIGDALLRVA